jgi:hypothetical protein
MRIRTPKGGRYISKLCSVRLQPDDDGLLKPGRYMESNTGGASGMAAPSWRGSDAPK